jgi:carboxymethylenebutenolidase
MDPEFEWTPLENSPVGRVARGHEEVRAYVEDWFGTLESVRLELEELEEIDGRVVATVRGHGRGPVSELALESRFCQLWTVREGRALRMEEHATREAALAASKGGPDSLSAVRSSTVDIQMPDGAADAYLTQPDDGDRHPGVLFIMDAYGLRPRIEEMADRIAERGYAVLAPNVFYRAGRSPVIPFPDMTREDARTEFFGQVRPLMAELTPERIAADGAAYLNELAKVADEPIAITGYCMGVRLGLRIAAAHPGRVAALAGFHGGGLVTEDPQSPHTLAPALVAELYFGHADNDGSNSAAQIAALEAALDEADVKHRTEVYEGAAHGYTMADTPAYDEPASERHFEALFDLLDRVT